MATDGPAPHGRFRLLGTVQLELDGRTVDLGPGKQRCLLAALLTQPGQPVPTGVLIDRIWGDTPPLRARNVLATYVARLRRLLRVAGAQRALSLRYASGGYVADCDPEHVDLHRARTLVRAARTAADEPAAAALRDALDGWHPVALAGLPGGWAARVRDGLHRERLAVLTQRFDVELRLDRDPGLLDELADLVVQYPSAEELVAQLMLALVRAGRSADALGHYARLRRALADEVGSEPSPRLRELHLRILHDDSTLDGPITAHGRRPTTRDLPRDTADFVGRDDLTRRALALAAAPGSASTVLALDGMPGVGKTALAVHIAHQLTDQYPDAQLFLDLRGVAAHRPPTTPAAALEALLRALGVAGGDIPDDLDERTARWRAEIARHSAVVVLDNAANADQVLRLLPGSPGCVTLVTSRRRLTELDVTAAWPLTALPAAEATTLFARIAGDDRARAEPAAAATVVRYCGRLPLAIRVAASRLRHRPGWSVESFADRLRIERHRLSELSVGALGVSAAFALSYPHLSAVEQRAFRLIGAHPGVELDIRQAAALLGSPAAEAEAALEGLVDHNLLDEPVAGRYRCHDLLRRYARDIGDTPDLDGERDAAVQRLLDVLLCTVDAAARLIDPRPRRVDLDTLTPVPDVPAPTDPADALGWFEAERETLTGAIRLAIDSGRDRVGWLLAHGLSHFLQLRCGTDDLFTTHRLGLAAARRIGDQRGEALMRNGLGGAYWRSGRYEKGMAEIRGALALYRVLGDHTGVGRALNNLGMMCDFLGHYQRAVDSYSQALVEFQAAGDLFGQGGTLNNLGLVHRDRGHEREALGAFQRGLDLARRVGDQHAEALLVGNLGTTQARMGQHAAALDHLTRAVELRRAVGDEQGVASALNDRAVVCRHLGRSDAAVEHHTEALSMVRAAGNVTAECEIRVDFGETLRVMGLSDDATGQFERALDLATETGQPYERGRALDGLGRVLRSERPAAARLYWERARSVFADLGVPEADQVSRRLAEWDSDTDTAANPPR